MAAWPDSMAGWFEGHFVQLDGRMARLERRVDDAFETIHVILREVKGLKQTVVFQQRAS